MMSRTLTLKQRRFVPEYLRSGNGTQAALVAYDTTDPNTAHAIAAETLRSPTVEAAAAGLLLAPELPELVLQRGEDLGDVSTESTSRSSASRQSESALPPSGRQTPGGGPRAGGQPATRARGSD